MVLNWITRLKTMVLKVSGYGTLIFDDNYEIIGKDLFWKNWPVID
jgi:hypothetical protein